jgi:pimeloyl-ACP methyl ester carboxylesterase
MSVPLTLSIDRSTTGRAVERLSPVPFPGWLRRGFQVAAWVSPAAAAKIAFRLFFTPRGARPSEKEENALAQASRFTLSTGRGEVRGYSWGSGPVVLLVHGWGGHAGQMTHLVPSLIERGLQAVALDMPAHGESGGRMSSLVHFSEAIASANELFGPLQGVMAHSFGAAATTYGLSRGLAADRVVFFAPPVGFESFWRRFQQGLGMSDRVWDLMTEHAEAWVGVHFADVQPRFLAPRLRTPLLVLHDHADGQVVFEEGAELASLWRGASLMPTRGLGHLRILRDPHCLGLAAEFVNAPA